MAFDRRETSILLIGDFLILVISLWVALTLRNFAFPSISYFETNLVPFLPMFLISLGIFYIAGLYEKQTRPIRRVMGARILGAQIATFVIAAILFFILPLNIAPKTILVLYLFVSVAGESAWRFHRMKLEIEKSKRTRALLVGGGPAVLELYEEINGNNKYLIRFTHRVDTENISASTLIDAVMNKLENVQIVVIDTTDPAVVKELNALYKLFRGNVTMMEFSSLYEEVFDRVSLDRADVAQIAESLQKRHVIYDASKRVFDIALSIVAAVVAVPIVAIAAIILYCEGGTPFIRAERIGKGEKLIKLLKLRTMLFFDAGDPEKQKTNKVTKIGRILRKTRIDELPQLWNIFVGDLSFIGPRPEFPRIAEVYEAEIPQYHVRHSIAPGLSGWAQIHDYDAPRGGADVARTRRKLSLDLYYLKHRSFGLDLAIATKTLRTLFAFSGS